MTAEELPVVLVVDDDPRALELMRLVLEYARYRVLTAPDPGDAISLLETEAPAAALFDYRMPGMNGLELTAWVRAQPHLHGLPIVLLTGMDDEDTRRQGRAAGADDVVTKPFDRQELLHKLAALIQR
jgi:DNA-binding response OmpR family regulator